MAGIIPNCRSGVTLDGRGVPSITSGPRAGAATAGLEACLEARYAALVRLAARLAAASDWAQVAASLSSTLGPMDSDLPVRVWGQTSDGFEELARWPVSHGFRPVPARALREAATSHEEALLGADGRLLAGLLENGVVLGVLELDSPHHDAQLVVDAGPIVASRVRLLAAERSGPVLPAQSLEFESDTAAVMAAFAAEARRLVPHDCLIVYLLTDDGRAFERLPVATSPVIADQSAVVPFDEFGLRHVVATNRPLVAHDLGADARIAAREERAIGLAGFHGLLGVPLRCGGRPIGVLAFVSRTPGFYVDTDMPAGEQIADLVGAFIEALRRERRLRAILRQEAIECERERVARELYHAVAQAGREVGRTCGELRTRLGDTDPWALDQLDEISRLTTLELDEARRAVFDASPRALDGHGLSEAVETILARFADESDVRTRLTLSGDLSRLPFRTARAVYRALQEALSNVRAHANASSVEVEIRVGDDVVLSVRDNGVGFDQATVADGPGLGLRMIRDRACALGGTACVESAEGAGTVLTVTIPGAFDRLPNAATLPTIREPAMAGPVRVLIAESARLSRAGVTAILESAGGIRIVGEAASTAEALPKAEHLQPNVIVLGTSVTGGDSAAAVAGLRATSPNSAILVLAHARHLWPKYLIDASVDGCIPEAAALDELPRAVLALADGATVFIDPAKTDDGPLGTLLAAREREVLALVAAGYTNGEIGKQLFVATKTVERQVATTVTKLGARNRAHAAALAVARQLVDV